MTKKETQLENDVLDTSKSLGVACGRFQIVHLDHVAYLLEAKKQCDYLYIGITNPDPVLTKLDEADPDRSLKSSNPFTYLERAKMIEGSLVEYGVPQDSFCFIPFPINIPSLIYNYAPEDATYFITIYDQWGEKKQQVLEQLGLEVNVLWRKDTSEKVMSGAEVRSLIARSLAWEELVPKYVHEYVLEHQLDERIRNIFSGT